MVFVISCSVRPEGLCLAIIVSGSLPRPARATPAPTQLGRARLIEFAIKEVEMEQVGGRISFGLKQKGRLERSRVVEGTSSTLSWSPCACILLLPKGMSWSHKAQSDRERDSCSSRKPKTEDLSFIVCQAE